MNLKQFKPIHWIYNILHYRGLKHNREAYKKYSVNKSLIASISSKDFPDKDSKAWLDIGDSATLAPSKEGFSAFEENIQTQILNWSQTGYLVLERFFDEATCDNVNNAIERLQHTGRLHFTQGNKLMFANKQSDIIRGVANDKSLKAVMAFLLDKEVVAFQTINFIHGSQQRPHSDSIHMTTYPLGYLVAAWIALEDITHECGPLIYYPGSHKLPFLLNGDYNQGATPLTLGNKSYRDYEDAVEDIMLEKGYSSREFLARKGDVLVWHANLVHGGAPIINPALTRKSMVIHFYATDVIKYHEITERPSVIDGYQL